MATQSVKKLSKQLAGVAKQAKGLGIDTSKADAMVNQTNRQGSKSFSGSTEEKAYNASVIPMDKMQNTSVANIPPKPTPVDYGAVAPPSTPTTVADVNSGFQNNQDWLNSALETAYSEVGSGEKRMAKLERDNQLQQKQQAVNSATESLNQIVAKQQQDLLSTRGTASANGVTEAVYGGQAATINREAAIQALPVQAQLAAAQNNLEMAQTHIDKLFSIQSADAQAKYQYKTKVIDSLYNFANAQQQRTLDQLNIQEQRKFTEKTSNIAYQRDLAGKATSSGQSSLAGQIMRLDPNSATYSNDLANLGGQVVDTTAALQRDAIRANIAQSNASAAKNVYELEQLKDPTKSDDQNSDLASYAQQYADTGKLPSVTELKNSNITASEVTTYAKQVPKPNGVILSSNTGIKSSAISTAQEDGINALYDIKNKIVQLKELDNERQKGLLSATVGKIFGSDDQQRYIDLRGEIVDLLARARTGAALTNQEEKFYSDQLPGRIGQVGVIPGTSAGLFGVNSQERINNFETKIAGTLDTKLSGNGLVIQGYSTVNVPSIGKKTVGEVVDIGGTQYRVLADGTLTDII